MSKDAPTVSFSYNLSILDDVDFAQLRDVWILPDSIVRRLAHHYLIYWNKQFLEANGGLKDGVVLGHQEHKYITILTNPLVDYAAASRVALSFRHPFGTKFGYVLVAPAVKRYGVNNEH